MSVRRMRIMTTLIAACLLGSVQAAAASQWDGWYGGASAGMGKIDLTRRAWNDGTLTNMQLDTEGLILKGILGYHFNRYLSAEVSYTHFNNSSFSAFEPNSDATFWQQGPVHGHARAKGVGVEGMADWPFFKDRFALFAKGGLFFYTTTMISRPTVAGGTLALGDEQYSHDDGVSWLYGLGAEMRLRKIWHIRVEWEHTTVGFVGAFATGRDTSVDFPSLGVTVDF